MMCLAVPAKLVECQLQRAVADLQGNRVEINTALTPEAKVGDWVLVHAGFSIQKLEENEAAEIWAVLKEVEAAESGNPNNETRNPNQFRNPKSEIQNCQGGGT